MTRASRDSRAAAGKRAGAPLELARVASDDPHILHVDTQYLGDDLREHRVVPLSLRADARGDTHLPARLDGDARPFVGSDPGAFHVADDPQADVTARGAQRGLLRLQALVI